MRTKSGGAVNWPVLGASAALVVALAGCVDLNGSLVILQAQIAQTSDGTCSIPAERADTRLVRGALDVALDKPYSYELYPLLDNRLPTLSMGGGPEYNRVVVTSYQVKIEPPPTIAVPWTADCPAEFEQPTNVSLDPADNAADSVQIIRPCHSRLFRALFEQGRLPSNLAEDISFRAIVKAKGRHGSNTIESDPFEFPVRICFGCLQTGYPDPRFADFGFPQIPPCASLGQNPYQGNPCNPGQDMLILCCARDAQGRDIECPGVPRAVPTSAP